MTDDFIANCNRYVFNTYTRTPIMLVEGKGCRVRDSSGDGGQDDLVHHLGVHVGRDDGRGRVRAHAAGVGAGVAVARRLWSWLEASATTFLPSTITMKLASSPARNSSITTRDRRVVVLHRQAASGLSISRRPRAPRRPCWPRPRPCRPPGRRP